MPRGRRDVARTKGPLWGSSVQVCENHTHERKNHSSPLRRSTARSDARAAGLGEPIDRAAELSARDVRHPSEAHRDHLVRYQVADPEVEQWPGNSGVSPQFIDRYSVVVVYAAGKVGEQVL